VWEHGFTLDDVATLRAFSIEEDARLRAYVESLDQTALDEPLVMSENAGDVIPRWLILAHVVKHRTTHRCELARFCTEHGHWRGGGTPERVDRQAAPRNGAIGRPAGRAGGGRRYWFHDAVGQGDRRRRHVVRVESTAGPGLRVEEGGWEEDEDHPRNAEELVDG